MDYLRVDLLYQDCKCHLLVWRPSGRGEKSNSLPIRTTATCNAFTSANELRKFTIHARNTNFPRITSLETNVSSLSCRW